MANNTGSTGTCHLNGGVRMTGIITAGASGTSNFCFNAGTLKRLSNATLGASKATSP